MASVAALSFQFNQSNTKIEPFLNILGVKIDNRFALQIHIDHIKQKLGT